MPDTLTTNLIAPVDNYILTLGHLPPVTDAVTRDRTESPLKLGDIDYTAVNEHVRKLRAVDVTLGVGPVVDVLYPGATVQARSIEGGKLAPVPLARTGGTLTVTTDFRTDGPPRSASRSVDEVTLEKVRDARAALLHELAPRDGAAEVSHLAVEARSIEHGLINLGVNVKAASFDVDAKASFSTGLTQKTVMVKFQQVFYTVAFTPPTTGSAFFAPSVTADDVAHYAGAGNPPAYVATVKYGRTLFFTLTSARSWTELKAAVDVIVRSGTQVNGHLDGEYRKILSESTIQVLAIGGSGTVAVQTVLDPVTQLPRYLQEGATFTVDNPGAPIAYLTRYAGSRDVVRYALTTEYDETVDVTGRTERTHVQIWDGVGGGARSTGIRVATGDRVSIAASGQNWSGVWLTGPHGPDGWAHWERPGGGGVGYPMPDRHPFALLGGYDNADWFYIGSGVDVEVPPSAKPSRVLWLTTNDDNPLNGDPNLRFEVDVVVTRASKEQKGLHGVGSTG
jgi:Thiol-activated cytolysin